MTSGRVYPTKPRFRFQYGRDVNKANMETRLRSIAIPGSVGTLLLNVGLPEAARFLLLKWSQTKKKVSLRLLCLYFGEQSPVLNVRVTLNILI